MKSFVFRLKSGRICKMSIPATHWDELVEECRRLNIVITEVQHAGS